MRKTNQEKLEDGISGIEDAIVIIAGKRLQVNTEFVMLFYQAIGKLIDQKRVTLSDVRVLIGICEIAKFGNLISLNQTALANHLGMKKSNMSKCISKLSAENILIKADFGLFINPTIIVKGKFQAIEPELWDEAIKKGFRSPLDKGFRKKPKEEQRDIFEDELSESELPY
jgi:hypothetical protein